MQTPVNSCNIALGSPWSMLLLFLIVVVLSWKARGSSDSLDPLNLGQQNWAGDQSTANAHRTTRRLREGFRQGLIDGGYRSGHRGVLGAAVLTTIHHGSWRVW